MYPRFLQFGSLVVSTYGVLAVVAALCGMALWSSIARRAGLDPARITNAAGLAVVCIIVGGRLATVLANWNSFLAAPLLVLRRATMSADSAALAGVLLACVVCGAYLLRGGLPLLPSLDTAAPALAVAAAVLDIGAFAAGSHYGAPTALPWGVVYTSRFAARTTGVPLGQPLHPVQLYAAIAHFALAAVLITMLRMGGHAGEVLGTGLFAQGALCFLLAPFTGSYLHAPELLHIATPAQAIGMLLVVLGGVCWLRRSPHSVQVHADV